MGEYAGAGCFVADNASVEAVVFVFADGGAGVVFDFDETIPRVVDQVELFRWVGSLGVFWSCFPRRHIWDLASWCQHLR